MAPNRTIRQKRRRVVSSLALPQPFTVGGVYHSYTAIRHGKPRSLGENNIRMRRSGRQRAPALCRSLGNFVALPLFLFLVFDACSGLLYRAACESLRRTPGRCNKLFVMFFPGMGKDIVSRSTGNLGVLDIA